MSGPPSAPRDYRGEATRRDVERASAAPARLQRNPAMPPLVPLTVRVDSCRDKSGAELGPGVLRVYREAPDDEHDDSLGRELRAQERGA